MAPGYYDLKIKTPKNLAVVLSNVKVGGPFTLPDVTLLVGDDANDDNTVDATDFGVFVGAYNSDSTVPGSGYDPAADFNNDGSGRRHRLWRLFVGNYNTARRSLK